MEFTEVYIHSAFMSHEFKSHKSIVMISFRPLMSAQSQPVQPQKDPNADTLWAKIHGTLNNVFGL